MFRLKTRPDTRQLVRAEHQLRTAPRSRAWLWVSLLLLGLNGTLVHLRLEDTADHEDQLMALDAENRSLEQALEQGRLQHREAEATQEQLLGRIATLSAQVERLQTDLAFFKQQKKVR
ncbi:hypothetical protein [Stutzerimonas stutzeri]|uniref:hypothetical protein n=1 Tax=Stutzerimonas stutzeri TaxID=316 RepID=UPI001C2E7187|nr:hypothetical protein [Stutzerimonas stutzeri]